VEVLHARDQSLPRDRGSDVLRGHFPPHFHARYGEYRVKVFIESGIVEGRFPRRALRHLMEWYDLHRAELQHDWLLASRGEDPLPIAPLE
jgi:hypothetical protein